MLLFLSQSAATPNGAQELTTAGVVLIAITVVFNALKPLIRRDKSPTETALSDHRGSEMYRDIMAAVENGSKDVMTELKMAMLRSENATTANTMVMTRIAKTLETVADKQDKVLNKLIRAMGSHDEPSSSD